uniref:histidine kinase n=1 Tax=Solibacter usitatus (strain Ellin6076) TaxID=234267 RepID=Q029E6_SOLUE
MKSSTFRRIAAITVSAGLFAALVYWYLAIRTPPIPRRALTIGFENVPPVQIRTAAGPAGLAVETVNEAARRAGITLRWVETGVSSEESFRRGLVDLWPIMADLPDRRKRLHITPPYIYTNHNLLLRPGSARPERDFNGTIAYFKLPLHLRLVHAAFPQAHLVPVADFRHVIQAVCKGTVDLGFLEDRAALAELRDRPPECESIALRVEPLPEMRLPLGVASTFECARAADRLRGEIGKMFSDGTLAATMAKYSYYGLDDTWSTYALMEASERARWVAWIAGLLGLVLAVILWQAASLRQRKRSESALRASEERFRAIFNQAAVGDAQVTLDGQVTMVNDRYCEVLGYGREELLGQPLAGKIHPDDRETLLLNRRRLLDQVVPSYSVEVRSVLQGGETVWIKLYESLLRDAENRPQYSLAVVEDITERRQAETALQESERRFRSMADTAPVMIWVAGADQRCTFFSQGWLRFTGSSMEDALGNGWVEHIHPESRELCQANFNSAFATQSSFQTECRLRRADGEYRWVLATGTPRFGADGAFAGYVGSCTDITDIKNAQVEALARQKLEGLGVLAGGIAHDFNNLLGSILATSELVLSELPDGTPASEGIISIKNVADRAAEIVRQMMAYSGQENTIFEALDLSVLVREMLQLLSVSISKRAHLVVDLPENLPAIRANPAQLRQVVMNLITNASEALGESSGVITVGLAHVRPAAPRPAGHPAEITETGHVRLTVADSGSGMTEEIRARIFDPFFTTKFAGRGLGLAAVRGIIRDHGGSISVFSVPGQGSRFEVVLPCTDRPTPSNNGSCPADSSARFEQLFGTILVVEDEEDLRLAVAKMLRKRGFSVMEAADGCIGVELFQAHSADIDVVLLDLTLPGKTGREVLEEVRRMRHDVSVILTTAYSYEAALRTAGGHESWQYLRKPYRIAEVLDMLRAATSR